ncbi:hypothetical protein DOTSEDRAFT_68300 [Dothistroma septosporum NZE10]|uniref:Uncharacterized protein n=1 Tax=Dothistroma septosporum (strain NZE10 / CBS 128990) TaxID=675120 RepID=N1Q2M1_DOTSN|nr:hypothetical protein DOTSEDRAFT_68300 [Dothistroma septosporum NZE10]
MRAGKQPAFTPTAPDITVLAEDSQLAYTALESQLQNSARVFFHKTPTEITSEEAAIEATTHAIDYAFAKSCKPTPQGKTTALLVVTPGRSATRPVAQSVALRSARSHSWPRNARSSQSSYLISPALVRSSKRRRLDEYVSKVDQQPQATAQTAAQNVLAPVSPVVRGTSSEGGIHAQRTASANEDSSELPTSYSISDEVLESLKRRSRTSQRSASVPGPQSLSPRQSVRRHAASQHEIFYASEPAKTPKQPKDTKTPGAAHGSKPVTKTKFKPPTVDGQQLVDLQSLSLVIQPPNVVAGRHFGTHITPTLQRLVDGEVAKCFKPTFEPRAIDDLERGHWRMNIPNWPVAQLAAFWRTLERLIGGGNAGWGVWCTREPDSRLQDKAESTEASDGTSNRWINSGSDPRYGTVRVYCWGEVVKHIYLLLYVSSNSKVRKLGLQWLDSQGKVVIQMPAKEPSRSSFAAQ